MSRCELHTEGPLANQCQRAPVLTVCAITGTTLIDQTSHFTAAACAEHAWEATAHAALEVRDLRAAGYDEARVVAIVDPAGQELLALLYHGVTVGDRWPLAQPWARRHP